MSKNWQNIEKNVLELANTKKCPKKRKYRQKSPKTKQKQ